MFVRDNVEYISAVKVRVCFAFVEYMTTFLVDSGLCELRVDLNNPLTFISNKFCL